MTVMDVIQFQTWFKGMLAWEKGYKLQEAHNVFLHFCLRCKLLHLWLLTHLQGRSGTPAVGSHLPSRFTPFQTTFSL